MFIPFFLELKAAKVPVSLREYLTLLESLEADLVSYDVEGFYYLARATLVKDERHIDRFDQVFSHYFKGVEAVSGEGGVDVAALPEEWLRRLAEKTLTEEEKKLVEALGGFDKLMETLKQRLEEQKGRHQGGSKWIGTAGTSPFGAYGYNPEGVRIGQAESRNRRAVKVWDKREFRNFDDSVELGTRNIKVALKRLRRWVREGADEELDLPGTIHATAEHGYLDVQTRPERRNAVKLLMFFDVGGSMEKMQVFMDKLERHYGQRPIIYTAPDFYRDNLRGEFQNYPFWLRAVAQHPSKVYPGRKWVFWQYSGSGLSHGVAGKIDLNAFHGSEDDWHDWVADKSS